MPPKDPKLIMQSLNEAAWLISRGVRPLALAASGLLSELPEGSIDWLTQVVDAEAYQGVHKSILVTEDTYEVLYAAEEWVLELYQWSCSESIPQEHSEAIAGLLLGYSPNAISAFLHKGATYERQTRTNPKEVVVKRY